MKKICMLLLCAILVFTLLPLNALALDYGGKTYDQTECDKLLAFLETEVDGIKNGTRINESYDPLNPETWGVYWEFSNTEGIYHAFQIYWHNEGVVGPLDISGFTRLYYVRVDGNSISEINITGDTYLGTLDCSNNLLSVLDASTNTSLYALYFDENQLESFDPSTVPTLTSFRCGGNKITSLDLTKNPKLRYLKCSENPLSSLKVSGLTNLTDMDCYRLTEANGNPPLTSIDLTGCTALKHLGCYYCPALETLVLDGCSLLEDVSCFGCGIKTLGTDGLTSLSTLNCNDNQLTSLALSSCPNLTSLKCENNQLSSLDLSSCPKLDGLWCENNQLSSLDLSSCPKLSIVWCSNNRSMTALNVGSCTLLRNIYCDKCSITSLDLSSCSDLVRVNCTSNKLSSLDLSQCPKIVEVFASGNPLTYFRAKLSDANIEINTNGPGYISPVYNEGAQRPFNIIATPNSGSFVGWSDPTGKILLQQSVYLNINQDYTMTANFASSVTFVNKGMVIGKKITLKPNAEADGQWIYDETFLTRDGDVFTALGTGETNVIYLSSGNSIQYPIKIYPVMWISATPSNGNIKIKESITISTNIKSGSWDYNKQYFSKSGSTFTALKAGTTRITYYDGFQSAFVDVTILQTPVNFSYAKNNVMQFGQPGGAVTITATGGDSGVYEYSLNDGQSWQDSNVFSGLAAGTYTAAVRDKKNNANVAKCDVTIDQPIYLGRYLANKLPSKANIGTALTIISPAAPKGYTLQSVTYTSSNAAIAPVDANGNVTFLAGGKATVIIKTVAQMTDKKGKVKTKTTTIKKTVTINQPVSSIALSMSDSTIARTQKIKLVPSINPGTASNKKVKWSSSNPKVAAVSSAGVVTGKTGGTAVITCTATDGSGVSASCTVTVTPIYPTGIKISKAALAIKTGKTASLKATVAPKNTDFKAVTWSSSNPAVATVDAKGNVRAVAPGTAVITAVASGGQTASCSVTVK